MRLFEMSMEEWRRSQTGPRWTVRVMDENRFLYEGYDLSTANSIAAWYHDRTGKLARIRSSEEGI